MNQDVFSCRLHQEHFDWLTSKHISKQEKLTAIKNVVAQHPDFEEAKELVKSLQMDIRYCENALEYLKKNFNQQFSYNENEGGIDGEDSDLRENQNDECEQELTPREPMDMLRSQYKGLPMFEIIDSILDNSPKELSSDEVTRIAYDTNSDSEFERAKASMSAQLRYGASKGKWLKVGRGSFASNLTQGVLGSVRDEDLEEILANNGRSH